MLAGGAGIDTVSYAGAAAGVKVNLSVTSGQDTGGAGRDRLSGFEHVVGSRFADVLAGSGGANEIDGGAGSDTLYGAAGRDVLIGGEGADTFLFKAASDSRATDPDFIRTSAPHRATASTCARSMPTPPAAATRHSAWWKRCRGARASSPSGSTAPSPTSTAT
ncbi:M10 family metallopeptidase C-terminal domain-containing protein [Sphingomonas sp. MMS24-JH45]